MGAQTNSAAWKTLCRAAHIAKDVCLGALFPGRCPYCGALTGFARCTACEAQVAQVRRRAGVPVPKEGHALEHLQAVYAPFWHAGLARNAIWRMKYQGEFHFAVAYARDMARCLCAARDGAERFDETAESDEAAQLDAAQQTDVVPQKNATKQQNTVPQGDTASQKAAALPAALPYDCIVPVPTTLREHHNRDNVPLLLAQALRKELCLPILRTALRKTRETKRQMALSGAERLENVKQAYAVNAPHTVQNLHVLLVDDVVTTGSTLNECAAALLAAGAASCTAVCVTASPKF